jgi:hypothetical protein
MIDGSGVLDTGGHVIDMSGGKHHPDCPAHEGPPLCSECDPEIGKWHGDFGRQKADGYCIGEDGFLYHPQQAAEVKHTKIVGKVPGELQPVYDEEGNEFKSHMHMEHERAWNEAESVEFQEEGD